MRVHRWSCQEKRRTLEDLQRLADKLRADRTRIAPSGAPTSPAQPDAVDLRQEKLDRTIGSIDIEIERAREELAAAERELAQVEQMAGGRVPDSPASNDQRKRRKAARWRERRGAV